MISVVIPTFNEAAQLPASLGSLQPHREPHEVIIVDAASSDATSSIAHQFRACVIPTGVRQRAAQMNIGAHSSHGEILLFLHADTRLAPGALDRIAGALQDRKIVGGGFVRHYDSDSAVLRLTCALAELRTRCCGWFLGDQAMFVRRKVFDDLGGFREWDIFEDLDFSRRLARVGRLVTLRPPVISAGRRFTARGPIRTTWSDVCLTAHYLAGSRPPRPVSVGEKSNRFSVAI